MLGLLRNRALLTLCLAVVVTYLGAGMVVPVRILYIRSHGGSLSVISAAAAAFLVFNFAFQYPVGWLADRLGRKPVLLCGIAGQALCSSLYLVLVDPKLFVVIRAFDGIFAASVLPSARAAIADLFNDDYRGRAYGLFTGFFNLGFLLGPALGGFLAATSYDLVFGLSVAIRLIGVMVVLIGLPSTHGRASSHEIGTGGLRELLSVPLIAAYLIAFGDYLWIGFDQTLGPLWMRHHLGASLVQIGLMYAAWALPGTLLVPLGGRLADRYPRWLLILIAGVGQVPMYLVYALSHSVLPVVGAMMAQACLYSVVSPSLDAHVAKSSPPTRRARVQSTYSACGLIGALAGSFAFIPLYQLNYRLPLLVQGAGYGVMIIVGAGLIAGSTRKTAETSIGGVFSSDEPVGLPSV